ncbi:hypothetical protein GALL_511250 [mine drainage metagenome]|uniref:Uncharacterized protein n=1 Tax=mine drainage metagenome TaxID=410659 RepID=A0A1J5P7W5_9ZZZZ
MRVHAIAPDRLANLELGQAVDHPRPGTQPHQQRRQRRHHGTEGLVLKDAQKPQVRVQDLQPLGQPDQHAMLLLSEAVTSACTTCSIFIKREPLTSTLATPGSQRNTPACSSAIIG